MGKAAQVHSPNLRHSFLFGLMIDLDQIHDPDKTFVKIGILHFQSITEWFSHYMLDYDRGLVTLYSSDSPSRVLLFQKNFAHTDTEIICAKAN